MPTAPIDEFQFDCDRARLGPVLSQRFRALPRDEAFEGWLRDWGARPHGFWTTTLTTWASAFVSSYDAHGWIGSYRMHLLSPAMWGDLLEGQRFASLLDVGAGAGYVTAGAKAYFDQITATETSEPQRKRLEERGFAAHGSDLTDQSLNRKFDVVSAFNVLDRTARPLTLLRSLKAHASERVIVSMPLPARPHVHIKGGTRAPDERLPSLASDWETAARELSERMLEPAGLKVERLARAPYLSRGDTQQRLYVLDDAIWVCSF
ncbi:MAG TPA: methyltransferase domain-containing protein [Polyangiales bacterium]|nr:methyltransferase domain-containing protein [Polyangiales bacterium]